MSELNEMMAAFEKWYFSYWKIMPDWDNRHMFVNQWEAFKAGYKAR